MKPTKFPGFNATFAKDQPAYQPLPAHINEEEGVVTSCWNLSLKERFKILFGANLYLQTMTFNKPLQPVFLSVENPINLEK